MLVNLVQTLKLAINFIKKLMWHFFGDTWHAEWTSVGQVANDMTKDQNDNTFFSSSLHLLPLIVLQLFHTFT
jgi:hypothetical protein